MRVPQLIILITASILWHSCQKEESISIDEQRAILMSTGWKMEKLIFFFQDERESVQADTLVLYTLPSGTDKEYQSVYTGRWIVFENDSLALSAFNFDHYSRPDPNSEWELESKNMTGVGGMDWGFNDEGTPYLGLLKERPIRIELVNEKQFILKDAYLIESTEPSYFGEGTITYLFGDYHPGTIESIDAVYHAAGTDEGPDWFPPWRYWLE
jgi:hypothetical protein